MPRRIMKTDANPKLISPRMTWASPFRFIIAATPKTAQMKTINADKPFISAPRSSSLPDTVRPELTVAHSG